MTTPESTKKFKSINAIAYIYVEASSNNISEARLTSFDAILETPQNETVTLQLHFKPDILKENTKPPHADFRDRFPGENSYFLQCARKIISFIGDADIAGYNIISFQLPVLISNFRNVGIHWSIENRKTFDSMLIFTQKEAANIETAYKFYCADQINKKNMAQACRKIIEKQLSRYAEKELTDIASLFKPFQNNVFNVSDFVQKHDLSDSSRQLVYSERNEVVINFGRYRGWFLSSVFFEDPRYVWNLIENVTLSGVTRDTIVRETKKLTEELVSLSCLT